MNNKERLALADKVADRIQAARPNNSLVAEGARINHELVRLAFQEAHHT